MSTNRNDDGQDGGFSFGGYSEDDAAPSDPTIRPTGAPKSSGPVQNLVDVDLRGKVLHGKYRVTRLIGRGTFGSVYEAIDEGFRSASDVNGERAGVKVAIKVLTHDAASEPSSIEQFLAEAQLLTELDNPCVVRWITFDKTPGGLPYFVMELLRGQELFVLMRKEGRLAFPRAAKLLLQILEALEAAHFLPDNRFILHLDLKPANVFIIDGAQEQLKVIDFGISQHVGAVARSAAGRGDSALDVTKPTDLGASISAKRSPNDGKRKVGGKPVVRARGGTISYASPEQCMHLLGEEDIVPLDGRADLYSVGIIAFEMLTGQLPWPAKNALEAVEAHCKKPVPRLAALGVKAPRAFQKFLDRCLAKDRDDRFPSVREARQALHRIVHPPSKLPVLAAVLLLIAVGVIWWQSMRHVVLTNPIEVTKENLRVLLGPEKTTVEIPVMKIQVDKGHGGDGATVSAALCCASEPNKPLPGGWRVEVISNGDQKFAKIQSPSGGFAEPSGWQKAVLRVGNKEVQLSNMFEIAYITGDQWGLGGKSGGGVKLAWSGGGLDLVSGGAQVTDEVDIPEVVLGADGAELVVLVSSPVKDFASACIQKVEARFQDANAFSDLAIEDDGHFHVGLSKLLVSGQEFDGKKRVLEVLATDKAGNVKKKTISCAKFYPAIKIRNLCVHAKKDDGRYQAKPAKSIQLDFEVNRSSADFSVTTAFGGGDQKNEGAPPVGLSKDSGWSRVSVTCAVPKSPVAAGVSQFVDGHFELTVTHRGTSSSFTSETIPLKVGNWPSDQIVLSAGRQEVMLHDEDAAPVQGGAPSEPVTVFVSDSRAFKVRHNPECAPIYLEFRHKEDDLSYFKRSHLDRGETRVDVGSDYGDGHVAWRAKAPDANYDIARGEFRIKVDEVPPVVRVLPPSRFNSVLGRDQELLQLNVGDELSGVSGGVTASCDARNDVDGPVTMAVVEEGAGVWRILSDGKGIQDGNYRIVIQCYDRAGNLSRQEVPIEVAAKLPDVEIQFPKGQQWGHQGGSEFRVEFAAKDGNKIEKVEIRVLGEDGGRLYEGAPEDLDGGGQGWAIVRLPGRVSGKQVTLQVMATDETGASNSASGRFTVLGFEAASPDAIEVEGQPAISRMRLVKGQSGYMFGVRADDREELGDICKEFGLLASESGNMGGDPSNVLSFYLDETEVSVGQFRLFLKSHPMDIDWQTLLDKYPGDSELPITDVTFEEAEAYARWAGKRLPTPLEWQFAVRGGTDYLSWSDAPPKWFKDKNAQEKLEIADAASKRLCTLELCPVSQALDRSKDGILGLCSNCQEWLVGRDSHCLALPGVGARNHLFWAWSGGLQLGHRDPNLGFRCALDAATLEQASNSAGRKFVDAAVR